MRVTPLHLGIGIAVAGGGYLAYTKFSTRMISKKGIKHLIHAEGKKNKMYLDVKGLPTIGVGHLITSSEPHLLTKTLTEKEIQKIFDKDLDRFEAVVKKSIKVPLKQYQKDALVMLAFNIGETGFKNSTLVKKINSKSSPEQIAAAFSQWRSPAVLSKRRAKEARLFLTGNYSNLISDAEYNKYFTPFVALSDCMPETKIIRLSNGKAYRVAA
jgi:lysozyme